MKDIVRRILLGAVATVTLTFGTGVSAAQDQTVWQSPTGDFSVTLPPGWIDIGITENDDRTLVDDTRLMLSLISPELIANQIGAGQCSIAKINEVATNGATQSVINDAIADYTQERVVGSRPVTVRRFTNEVRDGVRVIGYEGVVNIEDIAEIDSYAEHFLLVQGETVGMYALSCGLFEPASASDQTAVRRFLDSIDFHTQGSP